VKLSLKRGQISSIKQGDLFVILSEEQIKNLRNKPKTFLETQIASKIPKKQFEGKSSQKVQITSDKLRFHLFGIGKESEINRESVRKVAGSISNYSLANQIQEFTVNSEVPKISNFHTVESITEGILLGQYRFDKYKTGPKIKLKQVSILTNSKENGLDKIIKESTIICDSTNYVRDLQTENADVATPLYLEKQAKDIAKKHKLKIKVLDEKILKKLGAGLILAVGKGSKYPPRIIILEYKGNPHSKETLAIVGKGITFDSGGINLKPTGYIETMKTDMSGAATVLGTIQAAAQLKLKKNLIAVVSTAENAIGSEAYKPGDVFKSFSGKTVEIGNTDAEGRLVLADALTYIEKNLKPTKIIDIATLTGAVIVALGDYVAGMSGTDSKMISALKEAGENTHERVWELPLYKDYISEVKSDTADFNNINYGRSAGCIMGAAFLSKFVEKTPWTHLDIAGTSWLDKPRDYYQKGATGFGVRLLIEYLKNN
jgi:leucyl aminopeptidase